MKIKRISNILKYAFISSPRELEKPTVIQFPVIDICNSRCQMCRIWENKKSIDVSPDELKKGLLSDLFSEVGAIGFNGGEPTLRSDLIDLVKVVVESLPKLRHVSLITNAFKYKQVIQQIDQMASLIKSKDINFDVMVSLDGYEGVHDRVRGREGNFENAKKVINHVVNSSLVDNVRIGCTIIRENVYDLAPLLEYSIQNNLYIKYRLGVPHQRLYTENLLDPYALTFEEKYELVEFLEGMISHYEKGDAQNFFYRSLIDQIVYDQKRKAGCDWQHRGATITAKGELAYCAIQSEALMDNISEGDPKVAYFKGSAHLDEIIRDKCDSCNHDYVGIPPAKEYRRQLLSRLDKKIALKRKLKKIPGISILTEWRCNRYFSSYLSYFRNLELISNVSSNKRTQVLICGWYGTETLGDKAILGGVLIALRQALGDFDLTLVAINKYISQMTQLQMPELRNAHVVNLDEGVKLSSQCDFSVFGGGPLMAINELAPMQVIFENAKNNNKKTIVAGCGVGPFGCRAANESIRKIIQLADVCLYRDQRSQDYAVSLGVSAKATHVVEDPAFTWLAAQQKNKIINSKDKDKKILLLGLRDFPYLEYAKHLPESDAIKIKENYEKVVVSVLERIIKEDPQVIIRPLPMCTNHFGSDDRWFYRKIFRGIDIPQACIDNSLLGAEMAPEKYITAFADADVLLAMRFHSLVFGLSLGVKSIGLDYTLGKGKVRSLAERFEAPLIDMSSMTERNLYDEITSQFHHTKGRAPILDDELTFLPVLTKALLEL